jgi:hypothetical protein
MSHRTIRAAILTAALATGLGACGDSGTFTTDEGETGEYSIDGATGETTISVDTEDGTASVRSGADVPVELPEGFSIYPGAEVVSNIVFDQGGNGGAMVTMESSATPKEIADYYRKQAEAAGVEIQIDATVNGGAMVGGEGPGGMTFSINASPQGDKTSAQLAVGKDNSSG